MDALDIVPIHYKALDEDVKLPEYQNAGDAGMDIYSNEEVIIKPQHTALVKTGLIFQIPVGYEIQIRPRSGISLNTPLRIANSPATIDSGYRGEVKVIFTNTSLPIDCTDQIPLSSKGNLQGIYKIKKYERIAQIVVAKVDFFRFLKIEEFYKSDRSNKGFGSTGV